MSIRTDYPSEPDELGRWFAIVSEFSEDEMHHVVEAAFEPNFDREAFFAGWRRQTAINLLDLDDLDT